MEALRATVEAKEGALAAVVAAHKEEVAHLADQLAQAQAQNQSEAAAKQQASRAAQLAGAGAAAELQAAKAAVDEARRERDAAAADRGALQQQLATAKVGRGSGVVQRAGKRQRACRCGCHAQQPRLGSAGWQTYIN